MPPPPSAKKRRVSTAAACKASPAPSKATDEYAKLASKAEAAAEAKAARIAAQKVLSSGKCDSRCHHAGSLTGDPKHCAASIFLKAACRSRLHTAALRLLAACV